MKKYGRKFRRLHQHLVDSTACVVGTSPVYALLETQYAHMPNEISMNSRLLAAGITYLGFGSLYSGIRDSMKLSKALFPAVLQGSL